MAQSLSGEADEIVTMSWWQLSNLSGNPALELCRRPTLVDSPVTEYLITYSDLFPSELQKLARHNHKTACELWPWG